MAAPWEKYANNNNGDGNASGPWAKYAGQSATPESNSGWQEKQLFGVKAGDAVHAGLNSLPGIGAAAGGLISGGAGIAETAATGGIAAPAAIAQTVAGAGLGGAAGNSLKGFLEGQIFGKKRDATDVLLREPIEGAKEGFEQEMSGQSLGAGIKAASETGVGQKALGLIKSGASKVGGMLGDAGAKVGEMLTGVSPEEIKTYANHADEIKQMAAASDGSTAEAADQMRSKFADSIDQTRASINKDISSTLQASDKSVDSTPIVEALEKSKGNIHPKLYPEQIGQVDELISKVKSLADENGQIPVDDAHQLKQYLQDEAKNSYRNPGASTIGTKAANSAKSGAAVARNLVNEAEPAVAEANNKLSNLHDIEDTMNMNLINEGKPEAALISAGTGGNPRNAKALGQLGEATDTDMLGDAQKLAAMRTFGSPKLLPVDSTGKSTLRTGIGAGLGYLVGHEPGAMAGAALTSPLALRTGIDATRGAAGLIGDAASAPATQNAVGQISKGLLNDETPKMLESLSKVAKDKKDDDKRKPSSTK